MFVVICGWVLFVSVCWVCCLCLFSFVLCVVCYLGFVLFVFCVMHFSPLECVMFLISYFMFFLFAVGGDDIHGRLWTVCVVFVICYVICVLFLLSSVLMSVVWWVVIVSLVLFLCLLCGPWLLSLA